MREGILVLLLLLSLSLVTGCGQKTVPTETGRTGVPETSLLRGNENGERLTPLAIVVSWLEKESRNLLI
jgi:hypothetical protein